jgi:glycine betaine/proline transport system permease protein
VLDRLSQAIARKRPEAVAAKGDNWLGRNVNLAAALAVLAVTTVLSIAVPGLAKIPVSLTVTTAPMWKAGVDWLTINFFDAIEVARTALLLYFLNPLRMLFESLPWLGLTLLVALLGWRLGGLWLAAVVAVLAAFCAATDSLRCRPCRRSTPAEPRRCWRPRSGFPSGSASAERPHVEYRDAGHRHAADHSSFCFIIPVVMLFPWAT